MSGNTEIRLFNQEQLVKLYIKYIDNHNKLPLLPGGKQIDRKGLVERVKEKIEKYIKREGYCEGSILRINLIDSQDSIDKQNVLVSFIITKVSKSGTINVKMFDKKY